MPFGETPAREIALTTCRGMRARVGRAQRLQIQVYGAGVGGSRRVEIRMFGDWRQAERLVLGLTEKRRFHNLRGYLGGFCGSQQEALPTFSPRREHGWRSCEHTGGLCCGCGR